MESITLVTPVTPVTLPPHIAIVRVPNTGGIRLFLQRHIGSHWEALGVALKLESCTLESIGYEKRTTSEQVEEVLRKVEGERGSQFTIGVLVNALLSVPELAPVAAKFLEEYQK